MKINNLILSFVFLFLLGIALRLLPHPANFSPVFAVALLAGVYLPKKWSVIMPLALMLLTDVFLGFYDPRLMMVVYACVAISALIGLVLKKRNNVFKTAAASLGISLLFFVVSNFAVWALSSWYPHNFSGLMLNYGLAVPFFRNTLLSNLFFTGLLFGSVEAVKWKYQNFFKITDRQIIS